MACHTLRMRRPFCVVLSFILFTCPNDPHTHTHTHRSPSFDFCVNAGAHILYSNRLSWKIYTTTMAQAFDFHGPIFLLSPKGERLPNLTHAAARHPSVYIYSEAYTLYLKCTTKRRQTGKMRWDKKRIDQNGYRFQFCGFGCFFCLSFFFKGLQSSFLRVSAKFVCYCQPANVLKNDDLFREFIGLSN